MGFDRHQRNPDANKFVAPAGYENIGWQMTMEGNEKFKHCVEAKHKRREFDNSLYMYRCTDLVTLCDECKIIYHTDMSD